MEGELEDEASDSSEHKDSVYLGTSGHTLHKRMLEHEDACHRPSGGSSSSVAKHHRALHWGEPPRFSVSIVGSQRKNLYRLVSEALWIRKLASKVTLINQKSERGKLQLPRLSVDLGA